MNDQSVLNIDKLFQKNHNFLSYSPYLTFINDKDVFIKKDGIPRLGRASCNSLHSIGKKAFQLLEIQSESELQECCKGYFSFVYFIATVAFDNYLKGKLLFKSKGEKTGAEIIKGFIDKPTRDEVIHHAPELLRLALTWGNELSVNESSEEFNLLNDVYIASLTHILLEIDDTLSLVEYDSENSLESMESVVRCLSFAESITENRELKLKRRKKVAIFAANKRHHRTNLAKQKIREIWATGKYTSRDICAEQECAELNLSFSTARKALRNLPAPT